MVIDLLFILKSTEGRHSGFHGLNSVAHTEKTWCLSLFYNLTWLVLLLKRMRTKYTSLRRTINGDRAKLWLKDVLCLYRNLNNFGKSEASYIHLIASFPQLCCWNLACSAIHSDKHVSVWLFVWLWSFDNDEVSVNHHLSHANLYILNSFTSHPMHAWWLSGGNVCASSWVHTLVSCPVALQEQGESAGFGWEWPGRGRLHFVQ